MSRKRYTKAWQRVLLQTFVATISMMIGLFFLRWWGWPVATALASTNFVLFAMPHSPPARPRSAFGGHLIALLVGLVCAGLPHPSRFSIILVDALAVGLAFFGMLVTDTEHPPAAGTALSAAMIGWSWPFIGATLLGAGLLILFQCVLKTYLFDLESWGSASASLFPDEAPPDEGDRSEMKRPGS
jgi:CBS-domain-containing membrane protein